MIKFCVRCGKKFETDKPNEKYCSAACRHFKWLMLHNGEFAATHWRDNIYKQIAKNNPAPVDPREPALRRLNGEFVCMWCEQPVAVPRLHFCSEECLVNFYARIFASMAERGY